MDVVSYFLNVDSIMRATIGVPWCPICEISKHMKCIVKFHFSSFYFSVEIGEFVFSVVLKLGINLMTAACLACLHDYAECKIQTFKTGILILSVKHSYVS